MRKSVNKYRVLGEKPLIKEEDVVVLSSLKEVYSINYVFCFCFHKIRKLILQRNHNSKLSIFFLYKTRIFSRFLDKQEYSCDCESDMHRYNGFQIYP